MPILIQNVCFDCRKVFKKPEVPYYYELPVNKQKFYKCPDCGKLLQYMDENFRAPSKCDLKEWQRIRQAIAQDEDWAIKKKRKAPKNR